MGYVESCALSLLEHISMYTLSMMNKREMRDLSIVCVEIWGITYRSGSMSRTRTYNPNKQCTGPRSVQATHVHFLHE